MGLHVSIRDAMHEMIYSSWHDVTLSGKRYNFCSCCKCYLHPHVQDHLSWLAFQQTNLLWLGTLLAGNCMTIYIIILAFSTTELLLAFITTKCRHAVKRSCTNLLAFYLYMSPTSRLHPLSEFNTFIIRSITTSQLTLEIVCRSDV